MTKKQAMEKYLLTYLAEECVELGKECTRAIRFGLDDKWKEDPKPLDYRELPTPREGIINEVCDVLAVCKILDTLRIIKFPKSEEVSQKIKAKHQRMDKYMKYSAERGEYEGDLLDG